MILLDATNGAPFLRLTILLRSFALMPNDEVGSNASEMHNNEELLSAQDNNAMHAKPDLRVV